MVKLPLYLFFILLFLFLVFPQCKKDSFNPTLPPETTTGAMTFGCKVNGKVFVPRDGSGNPGLFPEYENLGNVPDGGWHLNVPAADWVSKTGDGISITTDSLLLTEGLTYSFKRAKGYPFAFYEKVDAGSVNVYPSLDVDSGILHISKFDQSNRILSGTFSFTGTGANNEKVYITEGRFDIQY